MHRKNKYRKPVNQDSGYFSYYDSTASDSSKEKNNDQKEDKDSSSDEPDPNYECMPCDKKVYIESEVQQHTHNFCVDCTSVTRHRRL